MISEGLTGLNHRNRSYDFYGLNLLVCLDLFVCLSTQAGKKGGKEKGVTTNIEQCSLNLCL
jgi:hypothetical protein